VTANLGVTRRRSLCRHVLLTAVWLNTTLGGSNIHYSEGSGQDHIPTPLAERARIAHHSETNLKICH